MNEQARQQFWSGLEDLWREQGRVNPRDVASRAVGAGLSPADALRAVREHSQFPHHSTGELTEALVRFVSSICRPPDRKGRVLEFTCLPLLLAGEILNGTEQGLSIVAQGEPLAEVLRAVLKTRDVPVFDGLDGVPASGDYEVIVCMPPLGFKDRENESADGFGGEIVRALGAKLSANGMLLWVTARGVFNNSRAQKTIAELETEGLYVCARVETAPGAFPGTAIEGAILALRREPPEKMFVGTLRDTEAAEPTVRAFLNGPAKSSGATWTWLDADDDRTFAELEQGRLIDKLMPRGRHKLRHLGDLLMSEAIEKADKDLGSGGEAGSYLFIPEYAGSRATAELEEQTVKPKAVYRLVVNPQEANARFLAMVLNSPYGREVRSRMASGVTIQRVSAKRLLALELPVPDLKTQSRIAGIDSDISLLRAAFTEMQGAIERDWSSLAEVGKNVEDLKAVLDIEQRIADWWKELPYPLATIYRRYQVARDSKERLETLLHFFEMAAVYLAAVGGSHVRALRPDWKDSFAKWLHPQGGSGIERADLGFWIGLAGASLKDLKRIASDKDARAAAIETGGPELVEIAATIGVLGKATEVLDVARRYRNSWKGHGGHVKRTDAERLDGELQQSIRDLYEVSAAVFRGMCLVRPGMAEVTDAAFRYEVEVLSGSDPTFERHVVELDRPAKSGALQFWMKDARTMCRVLPFLRLGAPQQPEETSCYVFNRVEDGGLRWISYQEAREQEFVAPDQELLDLISLGREAR